MKNETKLTQEFLKGQTWQNFERICIHRKIVVFGVGAGAQYLLRLKKDLEIYAFADNDVRKQGNRVSEIIDYTYTDDIIRPIETVVENDIDKDEVVILITSMNYFDVIAAQMSQQGYKHVFSLVALEYNSGEWMNEAEERDDKVLECIQKYSSLPINKKKIVFYDCGGYSGHGKYISEVLSQSAKQWDIVWAVKNASVKVPSNVRRVSVYNMEEYVKEMETALIWVSDTVWVNSIGVRSYLNKREGQKYIVLKHWSSITLKSFGFDDENEDHNKISKNTSQIDYILTGSDFDERTCRSGFAYSGKMKRVGSSRSDLLFRENSCRREISIKYNIAENKKLVLYAPTWRREQGVAKAHMERLDLDFERLKNILEEKWGSEWCILFRLHPMVTLESLGMQLPEYVIDVSCYEDAEELVAASDIMITDYSSIMFEFCYVHRPVFLYAPDYREYQKDDREFLIPYETLPFPIASNNDELERCIREFDSKSYVKKIDDFLEKYDVHEDGNASKRAAEFIESLMEEGVN